MSDFKDGLVGYDAASTQRRSWSQFPVSVFGFVCDGFVNDTSTEPLRPLTRNQLE